ncbi:uncharacterized protein LOC120347478 isoform X2 [Styela clava]
MELLKDVIKNFNEAITFLEKLTKIDKKQKAEKEALVNKLKQITLRCEKNIRGEEEENYDDVGSKAVVDDVYDDVQASYDDLGNVPGKGGAPSEGDDGIYDDAAGETYDDVGQQRQIEPIACEKISNPKVSELLELKKDGALKNILKSAWQKRWCVLKGNIFYLYESATDKQQKDAFDVTGYVFQIRDDITKEGKRKERCFELKNDEKSYEFCASDKENMMKWQAILKDKTKRGSVSNSLSGSAGETYDDVGTAMIGSAENNESLKNKKKGISFPKWPKKSSKSPSKAAETAEEENTYDDTAAQDAGDIYEETGDGHYDDTGRTGGQSYDDVGRMGGGESYDDVGRLPGGKTYDDTGMGLPAPPIIEEGGDFYEEYEGDKQQRLPPPSPSPTNKRRVSTKADLPPVPASPKPPAGFPTLPPKDETGSASGTFMHHKRPAMPLPGEPVSFNRRDLPPPPVGLFDNTGGSVSSLPPPISDDEFSVDSLDPFGEDQEDYENMYQGMWDCDAEENNELKFKREEIVHIISREYEDYGWWTAESADGDIGLVPVSYLMKAYDI